WVTWDVSQYAGKSAQIELFDDLGGGWAHILADQFFRTDDPDSPAVRYNPSFAPQEADALRWGDWNVSWRLRQSDTRYVDVTAARGEPYTWFEYPGGVAPKITVDNGATFTNADGSPVAFPATTDRLAINQDGRSFGVHAPQGTVFTQSGNALEAKLPDGA